MHYITFLFYIISGFLKHQVELLHEKGDNDGSTSGLAQVAMDKDIVMLQHGAEVSMGFLEVGVDAFLLDIVDLKPFVVLNATFCHLVLYLAGVVNLVVQHCQYTINPKLFFQGRQG